MITAPAPNTASPWISRTGNESLKPAIRLAAPSATVSAASAEMRILRNVGCCPGIPGTVSYRMVLAITSRWISLVPS